MLKFFATDVSVSKGYDGSPALRFSESDGVSRVRFRVGKRVYDSRCENNHRYLDLLCLERETPLRTVLQEEERAAIKAHGLTLNSFDQSQLNSL